MPIASKEVPKLISQTVNGSDRPLTTKEIAALDAMPKLEKSQINGFIERLIKNGTIHAWSGYRVWKEPEFDFFLAKGRELIREKPLWKSAMVNKLCKEGWGTTEEIARKVFDTLKGHPKVHVWPRHKGLRGDAISLKEVDVSFYLGDLPSEFEAIAKKLAKLDIDRLETARKVCGDIVAQPAPAAEPAPLAEEVKAKEPEKPAQAPDKPTKTKTEEPRRTVELQEPDSESERDFHRDITLELVFAWQDAETKEAKKSLERVMFNVGIRELGAPGDRVDFNGIYHDTNDDLFPDEPAIIMESGWQVRRGGKTRVLAKAVVKAEEELSENT